MNICFIVDYYPPDRLGGVGESARYLKEALEQAGHHCSVLTTGIHSKDTFLEKNVIRITKKLLFFPLKLLIIFPGLIKKNNIEIIHIHHSIGITALFWKHLFPRKFPAVVTTYKCSRPHIVASIKPIYYKGKIIFKPRLFELRTKLTFTLLQYADRYLAWQSDYLTSNSNDTRKKNIETLHIPEEKITVVHNGVALEKFDSTISRNSIRKKYSIAEDTFLLLYVGGFSVRKRVPLLFYILKDVLEKKQDVTLIVIGSANKYHSDFNKIIKKLRVENHVIMTGFIKNTDLPSYYAASDCVLVPSEYEPFGIINIEAMAMGKPVIASNVGGISDIIIDGETGILLEKDDVNGLVNAIVFLIENHGKLSEIGSCAYKRICEHFLWKNIARKYLNVYQNALSSKKPVLK